MAIFTALTGYLTTALVGAGFSLAAAGVVANIAVGAALIGLSTLASGIGKTVPTTSTPQAQATVNQSTGPRIRGYGRAKLGGTRAFWDSTYGELFQVLMHHHGRIDAFEAYFLGDQEVTVDSGGQVLSSPYYPLCRIASHLGASDQGADTDMLAKWSPIWTSAHRLRGIAYTVAQFKSPVAEQFQAVFPEGYNTPVRAICRLSRVWDPRDDDQDPNDPETWLWSDNAALCIMDYLTHPDGYNLSRDDIDVASFVAKANIDDQLVLKADGEYEKRYRLWGVYALTDEPQDVLNKMRAASDAELYENSAGKIAIRGGVWQPPTVTIRDTDILAHSLEQGNNRFSAFNELKIIFTSPYHDYQSMEVTSWENLDDQAERGVLSSSLPLDMVPSPTQARRLAKIHIAKSNPAWKGTISANLSALDALGERTIRVVLPELGIDDAFFVAGFSIRPDLTGVEISVMSISEAAYSWTTAEEAESPPVPQDTRPDLSFPVPDVTSLTVDEDGDITVAVAYPGRDDLDMQAQIRAGAGALWQEMQVEPDGLSAVFGPVDSGDYQVRARWVGPQNVAGDWSSPLSEITVS